MLHITAITSQGAVLEKNDDCILINDIIITKGTFCQESSSPYLLVAVCDGVGGESFGDMAAKIAAETLSTLNIENEVNESIIAYQIKMANKNILETQYTDIYHKNMATTIAGVFIYKESYIVFNVGDSRVYRFRDGYLLQISQDHRYEGGKHTIYRYCGHETDCVPYIDTYDNLYFDNDILVVCTDGITDFVTNSVLKEELAKVRDFVTLKRNANSIIHKAIKQCSNDNLSIILIRKCEK